MFPATPYRVVNDTKLYYIGTDSRSIRIPEQTLFFAIKSKTGDGHQYLEECYEKGIRNFILEQESSVTKLPADCNYLIWPSAINALQKIAAIHRSKFNIPIIGITGSNGKTIVKEWLAQLLENYYRVCKSPKSYNSQIGVPISVCQLNPKHTIGIFEAGISFPGEMEKLELILKPDIGILTNIGNAHQANFSNSLEKKLEKLKLFKDIKVVIGNDVLLEGINNSFTWGVSNKANIQIQETSPNLKGTALKLLEAGNTTELIIPFKDSASIQNCMQCYTCLRYLGISPNDIQNGIMELSAIEMRLEIKEGINGCTIINDSYNSDTASLSIALDVLEQQKQNSKKTIILSDIFESGKTEYELLEEISSILKHHNIDKFIGLGKSMQALNKVFTSGYFYLSTDALLAEIDQMNFQNEAILIKGSRSFNLERIAVRLQQKAHATVMEINLNSIIHNLNVYRSYLKPEVKIMAMVKASSYGGGAHEIANVLQHHKVNYLAVAYTDEGIYLRQHGISMPIMVMNPDVSSFESIFSYQLEPEIYSIKLLNEFGNFISRKNVKTFPIHIKIDSGMHRLGFEENQINELISVLTKFNFLEVKSIFTHLASTDNSEHDAFTKKQISLFDHTKNILAKALNYPILFHALNTAGITRFPEAQYNMVRLGIGMFGLDPDPEVMQQLECVSTLKSHISQIKNIPAGESVGYSRNAIVQQNTTIATIEIGYADGFPRMLGNGKGKVYIHGKEVPTIGNICMDMCMIDISGIPVNEGDEVIIFNAEHSIYNMAKAMNTIPYEVLTSISQRVKRVYHRE